MMTSVSGRVHRHQKEHRSATVKTEMFAANGEVLDPWESNSGPLVGTVSFGGKKTV